MRCHLRGGGALVSDAFWQARAAARVRTSSELSLRLANERVTVALKCIVGCEGGAGKEDGGSVESAGSAVEAAKVVGEGQRSVRCCDPDGRKRVREGVRLCAHRVLRNEV